MKRLWPLLPLFAIVAIIWHEAELPAQNVTQYRCNTISVFGIASPVAAFTPGLMTTFTIHGRTANAGEALCFPYAGATVNPTATPSPAAFMGVTAGGYFSDSVSYDASAARSAMGQGWACVPAAAATLTLDSCQR